MVDDVHSEWVEASSDDASQGQVLVIGCGALAKEILAFKNINGLKHIELYCFPAILHNDPDKITEAVRKRIHKNREAYESIYVAVADCGTGGHLDAMLAEEGVERIDGPHCYSFFTGNAIFEAQSEDEITTFYLTDYLARHFEKLVIQHYKLDVYPEFIEQMFAHYEKVVYLAQTNDEKLNDLAEKAAKTLGLAYERRFVGYGDLGKFLMDIPKPPALARQ